VLGTCILGLVAVVFELLVAPWSFDSSIEPPGGMSFLLSMLSIRFRSTLLRALVILSVMARNVASEIRSSSPASGSSGGESPGYSGNGSRRSNADRRRGCETALVAASEVIVLLSQFIS